MVKIGLILRLLILVVGNLVMAKRNKRRKQSKATKRKIAVKHSLSNEKTPFLRGIFSSLKKTILWLVVTMGVVTVAVNFSYKFLTGDVEVKFIQPQGRGYEFNIANNSSTDQVIVSFRVLPDFSQELLFKTTKDFYMKQNGKGVLLPGGNISYVPAFEFKALNGSLVKANSDKKFRLPPLSSNSGLIPDAMVVYLEYETKSQNSTMAKLEELLSSINPRVGKKKVKYLVIDNYWTSIKSDNPIRAVKIACRDDDMFARSSVCKKYR